MAGCCLHPTFCVSMDSRSHGCSTLLRCPHRCAALRSTAGRNSPRKVCTARQQLVAAVAGPPVQTLSACCVPCTAAAHGACDLLSVGQRDGVRLHFASSLLKGRPRLAPTATDCLEQLLRLRASLLRTAKLSKLQQHASAFPVAPPRRSSLCSILRVIRFAHRRGAAQASENDLKGELATLDRLTSSESGRTIRTSARAQTASITNTARATVAARKQGHNTTAAARGGPTCRAATAGTTGKFTDTHCHRHHARATLFIPFPAERPTKMKGGGSRSTDTGMDRYGPGACTSYYPTGSRYGQNEVAGQPGPADECTVKPVPADAVANMIDAGQLQRTSHTRARVQRKPHST